MQDEMGVKLVVAACNTSSSVALDSVSKEVAIPVIGTIHPMVETVLQHHQGKRIGIIATPTSVKSQMHEKVLRQAGFEGDLYSISCPRFVPIIESGRISGPELMRSASEYLHVFTQKNLDTLIHGCTHYPWIEETLRQVLPDSVRFIDPSGPIAVKASQELYKNKTLNTSHDQGTVDFYCSKAPQRFAAQVNLLLSIPQPAVTLVNLDEREAVAVEKIVVNQ
jgi:glutamate racemase